MNKIHEFLIRHRMPIGYFVGGANIISGLGNIVLGMVVPGVFWIVLGAVIIHDIRSIR